MISNPEQYPNSVQREAQNCFCTETVRAYGAIACLVTGRHARRTRTIVREYELAGQRLRYETVQKSTRPVELPQTPRGLRGPWLGIFRYRSEIISAPAQAGYRTPMRVEASAGFAVSSAVNPDNNLYTISLPPLVFETDNEGKWRAPYVNPNAIIGDPLTTWAFYDEYYAWANMATQQEVAVEPMYAV